MIPVDSIFSPVRKVSYAVENTRVEQMTDRDRLILDVETDGSVTPREARRLAPAARCSSSCSCSPSWRRPRA